MATVGRKPKYEEWFTEEGLLRIQGWAMDGLIDKDIAHNMGINLSTFYEWRNNFTQFSDALKKSKEVADRKVESELFKKATGFFIDVPVQRKITEKKYRNGKLTSVIEKYVEVIERQFFPAETTAQIYWTKNRMPSKWRDRIENAVLTPDPVKVEYDFKKLPKDKLKTLIELSEEAKVE